MARGQGDGNLTERKQALVVESAANRLALQFEVESIRAAATRLDRAAEKLKRFGPWLLGLVSVGGLLVGRRMRLRPQRRSRWHSAISLLRWLSPLLALWQRHAADKRRQAGEARG